jgi:hypothetical protein
MENYVELINGELTAAWLSYRIAGQIIKIISVYFVAKGV